MWAIRAFLMLLLALPILVNAAPQVVEDWSQNGQSSDPNGDGMPTEREPTPISYYAHARPAIYTRAEDAQWQGGNVYHATVAIELAHFSDSNAHMQAWLDLSAFNGVGMSVHSATSVDIDLNPNFDGLNDPNLLVPNQVMSINDVARITLVLRIQPGSNGGPYSFNMQASATTFSESENDISDNEALDEDGDRNANEVGENDPTTIRLAGRNACDIRGLLFHDLNHNSVYDESAVPDGIFCVILADDGGNPVTGAYVENDGRFVLADVNFGQYELALGMDFSGTCHTDFANEWQVTLPPGGSRDITVDARCADEGLNGLTYGLWDGYRVVGKVYQDVATPAHNGVVDADEPGVPNIAVLLLCDGQPCRQAVTNAAGEYEFWLRYDDASAVTVQLEGVPTQWTLLGAQAMELVPSHSQKVQRVNFGLVPENTFQADSVLVRDCAQAGKHQHTFTAGSAGTVTFYVTGQAPEHHVHLALDRDCDGEATEAEQDPDMAVQVDRDPDTAAPMQVCTITTVSLQQCSHLADAEIVVHAEMDYANVPQQGDYRARATTQFRDSGEPTVELTKTVANMTQGTNGATANVCDVLEYRIQYRVVGAGDLQQLTIRDVTAQWTTLWQLPACAATEPCSPAITSGGVGEVADLKWTFNEPLPSGKQGEVRYQVRVDGGDRCTGSPP